jgi:uncharacterized membrane protein
VTRDHGPDKPESPRRHGFIGHVFASLRNNFIAGVVVIAPIGLTVWLIWTVVGWVDGFVMPFVPRAYHPDQLVNYYLGLEGEERVSFDIRGVGVVVFLLFTIFLGWIAKGIVGRSFIRWGEDLVGRLPVVRSIYNALKQIAHTVFAQTESKFDKACLVEFPRKGTWVVAFISGPVKGEPAARLPGDDLISIFIPTTPNPTTGFLIFLPRSEIIELDMTPEEAAKLVISAGLIYPEGMPVAAPVPPDPPAAAPVPR